MSPSVETSPRERLAALGLELAPAPVAVGDYLPFAQAGSLLFVSGQLPVGPDGAIHPRHIGKVGAEVSRDAAQEAARLAGLNILAQAEAALGDLSRVRRVARLGGFVAVAPGFTPIAQVVNGASGLMAAVFGEAGRHARAAVGVAELPAGACVEIEAILEIAI